MLMQSLSESIQILGKIGGYFYIVDNFVNLAAILLDFFVSLSAHLREALIESGKRMLKLRLEA